MNCSINNCIFQKMNTFREQGQFTDVTFIIEGTRLKAHKNVLSCRSDVFEVMFTSPMTEAAFGEVVITDASKEVFEQFINYLYLNTFDLKQFKAQYVEMLYLAEKYLMEGLRYKCIIEIEDMVASGTLVYTLKVADSFNVKSLTKKVIDVLHDCSDEDAAKEDLDELKKEFRLSKMVLSETEPATVLMKWSGTLARFSKNQYLLKQHFTIRNNGVRFNGLVELWFADSTIHMYIKPIRNHELSDTAVILLMDRPVEMSYRVQVVSRPFSAIHSSEGNLWWRANRVSGEVISDIVSVNEELRRPLCEFKIDTDGNLDKTLEFTVFLTQWDRPNRVLKNQCCPSKPAFSQDSTPTSDISSEVDVDKFYSTSKKPLPRQITRSTYEKIGRYKSSQALPKNEDVDISLIYTAKHYSYTKLLQHCETVFASKLTVCNAVDTLILAKELSLEVLCSTTIDFIYQYHLEVIATKSWNLLENHPDLVALILKRILIKPPDFEPFSEEPFPKLSLPHEYSSEEDDDYDDSDDMYYGGYSSENFSDVDDYS